MQVQHEISHGLGMKKKILKLLCVHLGLDVGVGQRRSSGQDSSDTVAMASHFQQEMHLGTVYFPLL